jgi:site-specific DNA-methyltransferase (adenine-specific)
MNADSVCFSSKTDDWETPDWLFDLLNKEFGFQVDAAANTVNNKCGMYFSDALSHQWFLHKSSTMVRDDLPLLITGPFWLNPPYSKVGEFIKKAYEESLKGATVVCLIPSRTDTKWWHKYVMKADEIRFIKGRLKFSGSNNSAPFPSCIVVFRPATIIRIVREYRPKMITLEQVK